MNMYLKDGIKSFIRSFLLGTFGISLFIIMKFYKHGIMFNSVNISRGMNIRFLYLILGLTLIAEFAAYALGVNKFLLSDKMKRVSEKNFLIGSILFDLAIVTWIVFGES